MGPMSSLASRVARAGFQGAADCRLAVGDGFVGLRSEPGRSSAAEAPERARIVTVRAGSTRFMTSPPLPGSQEVDGSIPFSSTVLLALLLR